MPYRPPPTCTVCHSRTRGLRNGVCGPCRQDAGRRQQWITSRGRPTEFQCREHAVAERFATSVEVFDTCREGAPEYRYLCEYVVCEQCGPDRAFCYVHVTVTAGVG